MGKLLTANYKYHLANQLYESLSEPSNTAYYVYLGDSVPSTNATLETPKDSVREVMYDSYRNMLFGKRVTSADAALMIKNKPYVDGKIYDIYDDTDANLIDKDYYAVVEQEAFYHVYICLDNNNGAPSTVKPILSYSIPADNFSFRTSDGYLWKHMFLMTDTTYRKFATEDYVPSFPNPYVTGVSTDGSIYMVKVEDQGKGYDNYLTGTFVATNIEVGGNTTLYQITDNENMSTIDNFYRGCLIYLNEGTGLGQYTTVSGSVSNSSGNFLVLSSAFTVKPTNGTQYQVYPKVNVTGSGTETVAIVARALVNSQSSNSVYRVDILNRGAGYNYYTANVVADATVGIDTDTGKYPAVLRPIYPPAGGHGWEGQSELQTSAVSFVVDFANSESGTIPTTNGFRSIGLIRDPKFAEVTFGLTNSHGTFLPLQTIYKINPKKLISNSAVQASVSNSLTVNTAANTLIWGGSISSISVGSFITSSDNTSVVNTSNLNVITGIFANGQITSNVNILVSNGSANVTVLKTENFDIAMGVLSLTSSLLTCETGDFTNQFASGSFIYLTGGGNDAQLAIVNNVINSTSLRLTTNGLFSCSEVMIYDAGASLSGYVVSVPDGVTLGLTNVTGVFSTGDKIASIGTGAYATINTISRSGVEKGFNTFVQMYKYDITAGAGTFTDNEMVYQGSISNPTATAILHSVVIDGASTFMYTSNQIGTFVTSSYVYGSNSGATATINTTYNPELVFGSGHVVYKEYVDYVDRGADQTETVRLIFEF